MLASGKKSSRTARVLRQREWNEKQLQARGFHYYLPHKRLVMARVIGDTESIDITLETLVAKSGNIICYEPDDEIHADIDEYEHWPVQRDLFRQNYRPWNEPDYQLSPAEQHLMRHGCRPYYKVSGVWALRLPISIYVQSLESPEPVLVPAGRWLCIGVKGEPYHMDDDEFQERYQPTPVK